ncbi:MAG: hypothetical protein J6U56_09330 [Spirochaetia bacterium]|nr:hypothetical protein [Spirochaetia bacterium]
MLKKQIFGLLFIFISFEVFANDNTLEQDNLYEEIYKDIYEDIYEDIYGDIYGDIEDSILLEDGIYDKFLEKVLTINPSERHRFIEYYSNWYFSGQKDDFVTYTQMRAEKEKQIEMGWEKAAVKFGIGTSIIASTWLVAFILPGGTFCQAVVLTVANKLNPVEISLATALGGIINLGRAIYEGKSGKELVYDTLDGASDGYLIAVITCEISGITKASVLMKEAKSAKAFTGTKTVFDNKVYDANGKYLGAYKGNVEKVNGREIINKEFVNSQKNGITYKYFLADDGEGNFYRIVNPDFEPYKLVNKVYHPPKSLWNNTNKAKEWCKKEYLKDLQDPNVEKILGITKKEAAMRLQFEKGNLNNLRDPSFMKANNISEKEINSFLEHYSQGAWHHLPSSGDLIYIPDNIHKAARHTGGNSFWGEKLEEIAW